MRSERVLLRHRDHDCGLVALASSWAMLERLLSAAGEPQRAGVASQHLSKLKELPPQSSKRAVGSATASTWQQKTF